MKFTSLRSRTISLFVLIAFIALLQGGPAPAQTAAAPDDSQARMEEGNGDTPGSFEAEAAAPAVAKKNRKIPWLVAALGAVAVGVAVYFLVIKKTKYTLTIHVGPGATGTPLNTATYKKGRVITYSYEALQYGELTVTLDGVVVRTSGHITMDRDHTLAITTSATTSMLVNSTPSGARIYLDFKDTGFVTPHAFQFTEKTFKNILLRHDCGFQDWENQVTVSPGATFVINAELQTGIRDDFVVPISPCWLLRDPAGMSLGSGVLTAAAPARGYQFALYQHAFPGDYRIHVVFRVVSGMSNKFGNTVGIVLSTTPDMAASQGYEFSFHGGRQYVIYKNNRYNHLYDSGNWRYIKLPTPCTYRNLGAGELNSITIVKAGANYTLYVNSFFTFSFSNDEYDVRYAALAVFGRGVKADFEFIKLQPAVSEGSVPGGKLEAGPEMEGGKGL